MLLLKLFHERTNFFGRASFLSKSKLAITKKKKKKKQSCEFIIDLRQYHFSIVGISGSISLIIREEHGIECCHGPLEIVREMMA